MNAPSSEFLWRSITSEPNTGVAIVTFDGRIEYVNKQSVHIYWGEDQNLSEVEGRSMDEVLPHDFVSERLAIFREIARDHKPRLIRTIWKGLQHHAWVYPIPEEDEGQDADPSPTRMLIITRRTADQLDDPTMREENGYEMVWAKQNDLGPLKQLGPRELVVLALLGQGLTLQEVAQRVHRSIKTVQTQRDSIGRKLGVRSRSELQEIVVMAGLTLRDVDIEESS